MDATSFLGGLRIPFWFQSFGAVMGIGLAFLRYHHGVIGALKRGLTPLAGEFGHPCLRRPRPALPQDAGRTHNRSAIVSVSMAAHWQKRAASSPRSTVRQFRDGFDLYLHVSSSRTMQVGGRPAGHERRPPAGEALSLALGGPDKLRPTRRIARSKAENRARSSSGRPPRRRMRTAQLDLLQSFGPDGLLARGRPDRVSWGSCGLAAQPMLPHLFMPAHHDVRGKRCQSPAPSRQLRRRRRPWSGGFQGPAAGAGRGRADGQGAGDGSRGGPRERLAGSRTPPAFHSPMAARTAIRSPCR